MIARKQIVSGICLILGFTLFIYLVNSRNSAIPSPAGSKAAFIENMPKDWKKVSVSSMTAADIFDYLMWGNWTSCGLVHDFGGIMLRKPSGLDGQKAVCLDGRVAPKSGECLVYSFGISNEWSFDDIMETYGCQVFSFDPSMNKSTHNRSDHVHFYNLGLGGSDSKNKKGWEIRTLSSIYDMLKPWHGEFAIDYLKMDIEHAEWDVLPQIIRSDMINKIRQIGVEFHVSGGWSLAEFQKRISILKTLEDKGFVRFDSKYNPWCRGPVAILKKESTMPLCYELAWYRVYP